GRRDRDSRISEEADHHRARHAVCSAEPGAGVARSEFRKHVWARVEPAQAQGCQFADQRTADRRTVLEVREQFTVQGSQLWAGGAIRKPAMTKNPELRTKNLTQRRTCAAAAKCIATYLPRGKRDNDMLWRGFQKP